MQRVARTVVRACELLLEREQLAGVDEQVEHSRNAGRVGENFALGQRVEPEVGVPPVVERLAARLLDAPEQLRGVDGFERVGNRLVERIGVVEMFVLVGADAQLDADAPHPLHRDDGLREVVACGAQGSGADSARRPAVCSGAESFRHIAARSAAAVGMGGSFAADASAAVSGLAVSGAVCRAASAGSSASRRRAASARRSRNPSGRAMSMCGVTASSARWASRRVVAQLSHAAACSSMRRREASERVPASSSSNSSLKRRHVMVLSVFMVFGFWGKGFR